MYNSTNNTLISGSFVNEDITNFGNRVTIIGGDFDDDIKNSSGSSVMLNGGGGNDVIENGNTGKQSTIVGGEGNDTIRMCDYDYHNVIQYATGDGNDVVEDTYNFSKFDATLQITSGTYSLAYDGDDLLVKVGSGSIRFLGKADGKTINIEGTTADASVTTTTNDTVAPATTTTTSTPTSTPTVTSGSGGDTIINNIVNNYYGDYTDNSNNNVTIINQSSIGGDVTNNTTVDNSVTLIKEGDTYTYNGGDNANNQMYAGSGGSSLWGGTGGNDTLVGGAGYDEFIYRIGSGNDVIKNISNNDLVNLEGIALSQIMSANVTSNEISARFVDGGTIKIQGSASVGIKVEGVVYAVNHATNTWFTK